MAPIKKKKSGAAKDDSEAMDDEEETAVPLQPVGRPEAKIAELRANIGEFVQAQQTALEILTNLCCSKDEEWKDDEDDDDEEEMEDMEEEADMVK